MSALNMPNRTLGIMDNLPFLRSINNDCVDLIAIDPPFAANETVRRQAETARHGRRARCREGAGARTRR